MVTIQTRLNLCFEEDNTYIQNKIDINEREIRKKIYELRLERFKELIGWKKPTGGKITVYSQYYRRRHGIARTVWVFYGVDEFEKVAIEKELNKEVCYPEDNLRGNWEFSTKDDLLKFCKDHGFDAIHSNKARKIWRKYKPIYDEVLDQTPCPRCGAILQKEYECSTKCDDWNPKLCKDKDCYVPAPPRLVCNRCGLSVRRC